MKLVLYYTMLKEIVEIGIFMFNVTTYLTKINRFINFSHNCLRLNHFDFFFNFLNFFLLLP